MKHNLTYHINGLSYSGKETQPTLCKSDTKPRSGIRDLKQNKHQLLHRLASVWTTLIYNSLSPSAFLLIQGEIFAFDLNEQLLFSTLN